MAPGYQAGDYDDDESGLLICALCGDGGAHVAIDEATELCEDCYEQTMQSREGFQQ